MDLALPDFGYERLVSVGVCGIIRDEKDFSGDRIRLEASDSSFGERIWVRLLMNKRKDPDGLHLHVDAARESCFPEGSVPVANAEMGLINERVFEYAGRSIDFSAKGRFTVPFDKFPNDNAVRLLLDVSIGAPEESVGLSGAEFSVADGAVDTITWRKRDDHILASVVSRDEVTISESYLRECLGPLKDAFSAFVIGE